MPQSHNIVVRTYTESHPVTGDLYQRVQVSWSDSKGVNLDTPMDRNWQALVIEHIAAMLPNI